MISVKLIVLVVLMAVLLEVNCEEKKSETPPKTKGGSSEEKEKPKPPKPDPKGPNKGCKPTCQKDCKGVKSSPICACKAVKDFKSECEMNNANCACGRKKYAVLLKEKCPNKPQKPEGC